MLGARVYERGSLLRRQIHDDESVTSSSSRVGSQSVNAVLEERVVVAHQDDGNGQSPGSRLLDEPEHVLDGVCPSLDGNLVRQLDCGAICLRIRVRNAEFDDRSATGLHREHQLNRVGLCVYVTTYLGQFVIFWLLCSEG